MSVVSYNQSGYIGCSLSEGARDAYSQGERLDKLNAIAESYAQDETEIKIPTQIKKGKIVYEN